MSQPYSPSRALLLLAAATCAQAVLAQADLSLSLNQSDAPRQYADYTVTATLTNDGPEAATGVEVSLPPVPGAVPASTSPAVASAGTFAPDGDRRWRIPSIAPGASETLAVTYFLLEPEAGVAYAEVAASSQADPDSTPGNGAAPDVNEDDEASTASEAPGTSFAPDLVLSNLVLAQNPVDSGSLFTYTFDVTNQGDGSIGQDFLIQTYVSRDTVIDPGDFQNGTVFSGDYAAGQTTAGVTGATDAFELLPGEYFLILDADANRQVEESDEDNNTIYVPLTIGDGGVDTSRTDTAGIDLELSAVADPEAPVVYEFTAITFTLRNVGADTATDIRVDAPLPAGVVPRGGSEGEASQGRYRAYGERAGQWTVGTLAPGAEAMLTVNYFNLADSGYVQRAQVVAAYGDDVDSKPANLVEEAVEDDEVILDLRTGGTQQLRLFPNPLERGQTVTLRHRSSGEATVELVVADLAGRVVRREAIDFVRGDNAVPVALGALAPGVYVVAMPSTGLAPVRVVVR